MRVSQRLDYALRAVVLLAGRVQGSWTAAGELAQRLALPKRFVEQQISALARAGVLESRRGASGGCRLARPANQITVREVIEAIDGVVLDIPRQSGSAVAEFWQQAATALSEVAAWATIEDLAERQRKLDSTAAEMYYI